MEEDKDRNMQLDAQLCFALHSSARAIAKVYMETLRPENLTYPQYLVLIVLFEEDGLRLTEIGNRLHLDTGTLTPLIKRMEKQKLVNRRRTVEDERVVRVFLTQYGQSHREVAKRAREVVVDRLNMSDSEITDMRTQLMEISRRLSR